MAFPASKYARYKRSTAFFLDWLLRARGRRRHAGQRVHLKTINDVVRGIAAEPSTLTPKLLQELPKALAACQCSITLREHVATFFAEDDRGQEGHQHFLELLKSWHSTLKTVKCERQEAVKRENSKFENYYQVLQVDEDYFPDEGAFVAEKGAPKTAKVDRKQLFDEAFAEDLRLEVVYFFLELEELVEGVFTIYDQVKKQQRTMVEATVVVKLAMDAASALTAQLQLRFPALQTAEDVFNIVTSKMPLNFTTRIVDAAAKFWDSFQRGGTYNFVPGMLVVDFMSVTSTLSSFTTAIPKSPRQTMILRDGFFGVTYGEERTPQYVLLDPSNMVVFLMQQLPHLYNTIIEKRTATGTGYDPSGLVGSFMARMEEFFTSRKVTVPMVFTCICWIKSVAALQGNAGLSRNVGLTFTHSTKLMKNMEVTYAKGAVQTNDQEIHDLLKRSSEEIKQSVYNRKFARANPLLAGLTMLGHHFQYLVLGAEVIMVTSRFRAFSHLYNALVQLEYLQHIPFFDELLMVYDQMIFTPSRAAAVHGSYNRTYLLSSHMTAESVNSLYRGKAPPAGSEGIKLRKALHMGDLSKTFMLMIQNDISVLGGTSSKAMLSKAADICSKELFQTRVLSRDILKLNDDLTDAFSEMCDKLNRRQYHDDYIAHSTPGESCQYRVNRALEDAVMMDFMPLLDCLQSDGSLNMALPIGNRVVQIGRLDGEGVKEMCRKTAAVIKAKFATPVLVCTQKYFTFPARPDFINQEYGKKSFKRHTEGHNREDVFCELMDLLEDSDGPLPDNDLNKIKLEIKKDPELLNMLSLRSLSWTDPNEFDPHDLANAPRDDLSTLLHLAAAGPSHDVDLVEWMIQMGALTLQPTLHCRKDPQQSSLRCPRKDLCRTMAVHSAVISGHEEIVRVILEADNMVDLNTPTFDTKETLAHLAVKHGHRSLYRMLERFGADLRIKDRNGRRVSDMTVDRAWASDIANSITILEGSQAKSEGAKNRDAQFRHEGSLRAERLRQSVSAQRDQERRRAFANANTNTADGSKKSKKKKGKKGKKGKTKGSGAPLSVLTQAAVEVDSEELANLLKDLLVSTGSVVDSHDELAPITLLEDSIEKTAAMFARLRDPEIPADNKVDDAQHASALIEMLQGVVEMTSHPSRLQSMNRQLRVAVTSEAQQIVHMMQKLYRVDHAAIATAPVLAHVRDLCDTTLSFTKFVVGTAQLCVSVDRKPQAREILDILEKRLLKTPFHKREPGGFRELVQTYSAARDDMGMGRTSSPDTFRTLEWYLIYAVDSYELQMTLDGMDGRPFYFELTTTASARQFKEFEFTIDARPELDGVACFGKRAKHVVYGGASEEDVARVRTLVLGMAVAAGIRFADRSSQLCTPTIRIGQFVFSAAGIVRNAAAA